MIAQNLEIDINILNAWRKDVIKKRLHIVNINKEENVIYTITKFEKE